MKNTLLSFVILGIATNVIGQQTAPVDAGQTVRCDPGEIIHKVVEAQESLRTISYTLERTDTLVTGDTRVMNGRAMIRADKGDSLFGFEFQVRREGIPGEDVYAGPIAYQTDDNEKMYTVTTDPSELSHILWRTPGGAIILTDLVRLDTSGTIRFEAWRDQKFFYLRLNYADLTKYDVSRRSKTLTIDPSTMLPVAMRSHQVTLGKVQDLYYLIKEIHVNDPSFHYDFLSPGFLATYQQRIPKTGGGMPSLVSKGKDAPGFILTGFDDKKVSLADLKGKLVLLDFWEVWCGPCLESMPKVQHLYDAYKDKGLLVFGVIHEAKQLEPAKLLRNKMGIRFPMLVGNEQSHKDYKVATIPMYVLIDKTGKVLYVSLGYTAELETAIGKALAG